MSKHLQITLPFWAVIPRHPEGCPPSPPHEPCDESAIMFPNSERAGAFLDYHPLSGRQLILIVESELLFFVADLHARGVTVVCCDPEPDGSGGINVDLADFMSQVEQAG